MLLFRRDSLHLGDVLQRLSGQHGEGLRQHLDLVARAVGVFHVELQVVPTQGAHAPGDCLQRLYDAL